MSTWKSGSVGGGDLSPTGEGQKAYITKTTVPTISPAYHPSPGDPGEPDLVRGKDLFCVPLGNPSSFFSGSVLILTFGSVEILCQYSQYTNGESRQP